MISKIFLSILIIAIIAIISLFVIYVDSLEDRIATLETIQVSEAIDKMNLFVNSNVSKKDIPNNDINLFSNGYSLRFQAFYQMCRIDIKRAKEYYDERIKTNNLEENEN